MGAIEFCSNYDDLSTDKGFQFRFHCDKCGNGYMSSFRASALGMASSALQAAGNLFGGIFGGAAHGAYEIQRAVGGPAHDAALREATAEIKPKFKQCTRCGGWVCEPVCWNGKAGLCERCAPDLDEEMAAAQAEAAKEQVHVKAREVDWTKGRDVAQVTGAVCPHCHAKAKAGAKFCGDCGKPLAAAAKRFCPGCGASLEGNPKFCPECGGATG